MIDLKELMSNIGNLVKYGSNKAMEYSVKNDEDNRKIAEAEKKKEEQYKQMLNKQEMEQVKKNQGMELHSYKVQEKQLSLMQKIKDLLMPDLPEEYPGQNNTDEQTAEMNKLFNSMPESKVTEEQPTPTPTETPVTAEPTPIDIIAEAIKNGLNNYGEKSNYENPLATMSAKLASAGQQNNLPDPYLLPTINLKETTGSKFMKNKNNYFNYGDWENNDIGQSIDQVSKSIGKPDGLYKDYLQSGDMADFFKVYTPTQDPLNPSYQEQIRQFNQLRKYFPE
jgi:hypothetical protein